MLFTCTSGYISQSAVQAAGQNPTKEQCRRMDGAFLAVGALNDVLRAQVSSFPSASHAISCNSASAQSFKTCDLCEPVHTVFMLLATGVSFD